jgi:hypothetical protein
MRRGAASTEDTQTTDISLYQHAKRPEWGLAVPIDHLGDRRIFLFESGECRTIMNEYAHLMAEVEPEEDVAAQARKYFAKHAAPKAPSTRAKKTTRRAAPRTGAKRATRKAKSAK